MHILFILACSFLISFNGYTSSIIIRTIEVEGKPAYVIQAGSFANKKNAEELKKNIEATDSVKMKLLYLPEKKLWLVKTLPITDYDQAKRLQNSLRSKEVAAENVSSIPSSKPSEKKLWNLKNADIRAVISEVSRITGKNFIIDPRVQGKISIVSATPISDKELYEVFLSMLQISGYAAIINGEIIKIVPNIDAKTLSPDVLSTMSAPTNGDAMLVEVIPVRNVPADQLVPVLRPLMPQWSSVSAYSPSNMLILSGRANNIKQLAEIIRQVDDSATNDIDVVTLQYAMAIDIANTLKDLVKSPAGPGRQATTLSADDRSNSILISGSKTERIRIRLIINKLDKKNAGGMRGNTQVIYLSYLRAEDLVPILAGIAQANFSGNVGTTIGTITKPELDSTHPSSSLVSGSASTNLGGSQSSPVATSSGTAGGSVSTTEVSTTVEGTSKPTVQIIAEPNTNSIILNAPPNLNAILRSVISQLDIRPAQLLIEALVAEINESDVNNLGIEWGSVATVGTDKIFRNGFAIIDSKTSINDFQAQIYALAENRRANILSTPSVVVLDNQQAKILVGKQVSVQSSSFSGNSAGGTGGVPFTTFDRINVALHLYVRPQITSGRGIKMQIDQGNDTIDPGGSLASTNPVFNISSIVTSIHIESGDVVILGGLAQDGFGNEDNHLSILGDIPGIGRLFQRNKRTREKKVLMVFIKPVILRDEKDTVIVSGAKYNSVRQSELEMLRKEEVYIRDDKDLYLPPLHNKDLPIPFSSAMMHPVKVQPVKRIRQAPPQSEMKK